MTPQRIPLWGGILAMVLTASPAWAADPKSDSVTVLPGTSAALVFGNSDKLASVEYSQLLPGAAGWGLYVKASAPIDEETRNAAFTSDHHLASGFKGQIQSGYDSRARRVGTLEAEVEALGRAIETLHGLPEIAVSGAQARFARAHGLPGDDASIYRYLCNQGVPEERAACGDATRSLEMLAEMCLSTFTLKPPADASAEAERVHMLNEEFKTDCEQARRYAAERANAEARLREAEQNPPDTQASPSEEQQASARKRARDAAVTAERNTFSAIVQACTAFTKSHCSTAESLSDDKCFVANWMGEMAGRQQAHLAAQGFVTTQQLVAERLMSLLMKVDPEATKKFREKYGSDAMAVLNEHEAFAKVLRDSSQQKNLLRRDILLTGVAPSATGWDHAIGLDLSVTYDRHKVFQGNVGTAGADESQYQVGAGVNYTAYLPLPGLSSNLRVGYERIKDVDAKKIERCVSRPSSDGNITGRQCDSSVLYRTGAAPNVENTFYARVAIGYQYMRPADAEVLPGLEVRAGLEGINGTRSSNLRFTLFGTPVKGESAARAGVALDLSYAIDQPDSTEPSSRWAVTPIVFVGASLGNVVR